MDFFIFFVFAHLIGDFVLQTNKIAAMKSNGMKGLMIHSSIITTVQVFFLCFFGFTGICLGIVGGLAHFLIDILKNRLQPFLRKIEFVYFLFDQTLHLISIFILTQLFLRITAYQNAIRPWGLAKIPNIIDYMKLGIGFIILAYVCTVAIKILLRNMFEVIEKDAFFKNKERVVDAVVCFAIIIALQFSGIYFVLLLGISFLAFYYLESIFFNYSIKVIVIKYAFFFTSSLVIHYFITT